MRTDVDTHAQSSRLAEFGGRGMSFKICRGAPSLGLFCRAKARRVFSCLCWNLRQLSCFEKFPLSCVFIGAPPTAHVPDRVRVPDGSIRTNANDSRVRFCSRLYLLESDGVDTDGRGCVVQWCER